MKLVYTHPTAAIVAQAKSAIEHAGIDCTLRNEYAGGAIGELAPLDAWVEVWVVRDRDVDAAKQIVERLQTPIDEPDWNCKMCQSGNPATFESCWSCGALNETA